MKIKILILLVTILFISCQNKIERENNDSEKPSNINYKTKAIQPDKIEIITYDDCEYLILKEEIDANSAYGFMAHKGNCSNPIHEHNKRKE